MGVSFSCPLSDYNDFDRRLESVLVRSLSMGSSDVRTALRSLSLNAREFGRKITSKTPTADMENRAFSRPSRLKNMDASEECSKSEKDSHSQSHSHSSSSDSGNRSYNAALKLQKVYKSFRTRRRLADCAVLVEQRWWKLLDFVELKRSSISFFDEKRETAISRWSRARTRAAKVGKGLSKDEKARKLALQHWLEAIDPRHRYGHNLQFYYVAWLHCDSKQPFFYWLDIGDGKEFNLERCPRSKLQHQCIKYLGPTEREIYEVRIENGKLVYKQSREVVDTSGCSKDVKWIFVLSASKSLYVGQKKKGNFQHSSFLAGGATLSAGRLVAEDGLLKAIWPHSGHYLPTEENFQEFMSFLSEHNVDLTDVQKGPTEDDEEFGSKMVENGNCLDQGNDGDSRQQDKDDQNCNQRRSRKSRFICSKITKLEIPSRGDVYDIFKTEVLPPSCRGHHVLDSSSDDGYETAEETILSEEDFMFPKKNLFGEDDTEENEKPIPKEKIMKRIDSHKGMKSYQLAQQLSSKWSTGAGPRISCMRDYPSELQFRVLEQSNLSPRAKSTNVMTPSSTSLFKQTTLLKSPLALDPEKFFNPLKL